VVGEYSSLGPSIVVTVLVQTWCCTRRHMATLPTEPHTMAADSCAPCGTVYIHPGAHAPVQAVVWPPMGELGRFSQCDTARTVLPTAEGAERSPVVTCTTTDANTRTEGEAPPRTDSRRRSWLVPGEAPRAELRPRGSHSKCPSVVVWTAV
jgi:hypothetical protein